MAKLLSLVDRLRRAPPSRSAPDAPACVLPMPLPAPARITTVRPFDPEWDDVRKADNHAPEKFR